MKKQILIYSLSLFAICTLSFGRANASCGQPVEAAMRVASKSSAIIEWTQITGVESYNVRYRLAGALNWTYITTTTESVLLQGLMQNQNYEYQVQAICWRSNSEFSEVQKFLNSNVAITAPVLSTPNSVSGTGASFSWPSVPGISSYQVQWKAVNANNWNIVNGITTNSFSPRNLAPCTGYQFRVSSMSQNYLSTYSNVISFTTNCPTTGSTPASPRLSHSENAGSAVVSLYPNPVIDYLNIEYRSANSGTINTNVYNMIGKVVMNWTTDVQEGPNDLKFNASQLAAGIYFFEIENRGEITRSKFMVAN